MSDIKLYIHPYSPNCRHPQATALHLGMDVEVEVVDLAKGAQRNPTFLAVNPNGMVPAMVEGDFRLFESNAICLYLADKSPRGSELVPTEPHARAQMLQWMFWRSCHWSPACGGMTWNNFFAPMMGVPINEAALRESEEKFRRYAPVLAEAVAKGPWILGDSLSLADFTLASNLMFAGPAKIPVDEYPAIRAWYGRVEELDAWRKSAPKA